MRNGLVRLARPLTQIRVPTTVQAVLASRLDRLPAEEKELLQTLAVLGREFPLGLVQGMTHKPNDELEPTLARLQAGEFIYEQPATGDIQYTFKHALTQEVAYNSLLIGRRKNLHERAGQALEAMFSDHLDEHLSELAHHYATMMARPSRCRAWIPSCLFTPPAQPASPRARSIIMPVFPSRQRRIWLTCSTCVPVK